MAFNILPVLKFIANSRAIASTVNNLMGSYKDMKAADISKELKESITLQSEINEKIEKQIEQLQKAIINNEANIRAINKTSLLALILTVLNLALILIFYFTR
jgi:hypothetical protein